MTRSAAASGGPPPNGRDLRAWAQSVTHMHSGSKLTGPQKLVLLIMAMHCQTGDECWPSVTRISDQTCMSRRAVINAIAGLSEGGIVRRTIEDGKVNRYRIVMEPTSAPDALVPPSPTSAPCAPPTRAPDAPVDVGLVHVVHGTSARGAPELQRKYSKGNRGTPSLNLPLLSVLPGGRVPTFAEFYAAYPRKAARPRAEKAWAALMKLGIDPNVIMRGLAGHQFHPEPRLRPHPATWLNAHQWADEQPPNLYANRSPRQYTPESYIDGVRRAAGVNTDPDSGDFLDANFLKQGLLG